MGKRGPAPKPTKLKVLEGNPGKRPLNESEPKPAPKVPDKPTWMKLRYYKVEETVDRDILKYANEFWDKNAKILFNLGLLTELDTDSFAVLCLQYGSYISAKIKAIRAGEVAKFESGYMNQHPYALRADKSYDRYKKMAQEFGFTPSSRSDIEVENSDAADEMEGLLTG